MAVIDSLLEFSDAQALTATAASTNVIDLSVDRDVGVGTVLYVVVSVAVALDGTTPTFKATLQTDDSAAFSSPTTLVETATVSSAPAGTMFVLAVPYTNERYLRLNYTLGGTTPTITVDAWLTDQAPYAHRYYPEASN